jgi:hypothetical protein
MSRHYLLMHQRHKVSAPEDSPQLVDDVATVAQAWAVIHPAAIQAQEGAPHSSSFRGITSG